MSGMTTMPAMPGRRDDSFCTKPIMTDSDAARIAGNIRGRRLETRSQTVGFAADGLCQAGVASQVVPRIGIDGALVHRRREVGFQSGQGALQIARSSEKSMASIRRSSSASMCRERHAGWATSCWLRRNRPGTRCRSWVAVLSATAA